MAEIVCDFGTEFAKSMFWGCKNDCHSYEQPKVIREDIGDRIAMLRHVNDHGTDKPVIILNPVDKDSPLKAKIIDSVLDLGFDDELPRMLELWSSTGFLINYLETLIIFGHKNPDQDVTLTLKDFQGYKAKCVFIHLIEMLEDESAQSDDEIPDDPKQIDKGVAVNIN